MKPEAGPVRKQADEEDEQGCYACVDHQGRRRDGGFFIRFVAAADVADMGIFQQARLGLLENGGDDQEQGPGAHLGFGQGPDQDDKIDEAKESYRETLQNGIEGGADPV